MHVDLLALGILPGRVRLSANFPLGGQEPLHPHRAPRVDPSRRDANLSKKCEHFEQNTGSCHLCTETETEAISESGAGIVENARRVDRSEELLCRLLVFRHNHVSVAGAIPGSSNMSKMLK